ncbi:multidrug DMT transporter permease [Salinispirillum sp. LH 10-3-1]|uniref:Multidrug DMT transporter permease n=1 Tax=Salinispirillum sp. LH 10-3-1 TaxID=2952525 RepID=A0AB38YIX1_9GAMM
MSALAHAAWNFSGKKGGATIGSFWLATGWSAILCSPLIVYGWPLLQLMPLQLALLLLLSGAFQAIYLCGLTLAYQRGELSLLYPLIRSSPLLLLLLSGLLFGAMERVSQQAVVGIVMIVGGCLFLPMRHFRDVRLSHYTTPATYFALLAAAATAGYSLVDDHATRLMRQVANHQWHDAEIALVYVVLQAWAAWLWMTLLLFSVPRWRPNGWRGLSTQHGMAMLTGLLILLTYALVVWAMAYARDVSYVVAFRQVSILLGVAMGAIWLKESLSGPRLLGVAILFTGLVLVTLG